MIKLNKLSKYYQDDIAALRDVSLEVVAGSICGVIGKSGAGKSTLIRCVNLLERPTQGEIWVDGVELTTLDAAGLKQQRQHMGMIFQHFHLLQSRDVFANIALPMELVGRDATEIRRRVLELLELVDLSDKVHAYPAQLSGGQQQRVAIARALALAPNVLLCDEATSALDPESTLSILKLLQQINQELGITILLITHEMDVIKTVCNQVAVLADGELIETGSVLEIFARPQHPLTQRLTQHSLHMDLPQELSERLSTEYYQGAEHLVRLTFVGEVAKQPVLQELYENYSVRSNILLADLEMLGGQSIGVTICAMNGDRSQLQQALDALPRLGVQAEVLGYV